MIVTITNHISEGLRNLTDTSQSMNWYGSNFNMPVPAIFANNTSVTRYLGNVTKINPRTSYNLSSFSPGFEICVGLTNWDFENDGASTYNINTQLYNRWTDPSLNTIFWGFNGYTFTYALAAGTYVEMWQAINTGCAGWEVSVDGTYHYRSSCLGTPSWGTIDQPVVMSNVPDTTQLSSDTYGYIWIEGNDLAYINASGWKHTIAGTDLGYVGGETGYFWNTPGTAGLVWIGDNGHKYCLPWIIKQFASSFSNGPTGAKYAGTSNGGKIWVDDEFGQTHLAYISSVDGYKYLAGAGNYPY